MIAVSLLHTLVDLVPAGREVFVGGLLGPSPLKHLAMRAL
jgi:hypothetical protein